MAQIFRPASNTLAKLSVFFGAVAPLATMIIWSQFTRSSQLSHVETPYEQPVPFSHEHHVTELGIDCRYCHTSVEYSSEAGYPPTHTCMSCHSQIWTNSPLLEPVRQSYVLNVPLKWTVLNKVPDFVYFNHSIHIKRGVSCNNCHGPIQAMQIVYKGNSFQMRWCLDCHRNPEKYVNTPDFVWNLYRKIQAGAPLTPEEKALSIGRQYHRDGDELRYGKQLVARYHIKTAQLADCSVCHR
jgi:hypothetical protein